MYKFYSKLKFYTAIGFIGFCFITFLPKILSPLSLATSLMNKQTESSTQLHELCHKDPGDEKCPRAVFIWKILWDMNNEEFSPERIASYVRFFETDPQDSKPDHQDSEDAKKGQLIYDNYRLQIQGFDESIGALLRFSRTKEQLRSEPSEIELQQYSEKYLIKRYLASAGFSESTATYKYPCTVVGELTIGWDERNPGEPNDSCTVKYNRNLHVDTDYNSRNRATPLGLDSKQANLGGVPVLLRHYCSVLATSTASNSNAWSIQIGDIQNISYTNLCNKAIEECQAKAGGECVIVEHGYWRTYHPQEKLRKVRLLFRCKDSERYDQIIGANDVTQEWENLDKKFQKNSSCILSVYNRDDVLIKSNTTGRTLIHTDEDNAQIKITILLGKVSINLPGDPDQVGTEPGSSSQARTLDIEAGEHFTLDLSSFKDSERRLSDQEIKAIIELPVVQAFLEEKNWEELYQDDPIKEQIKGFRNQLIPPPPGEPIIIKDENGSEIAEVIPPPSCNKNKTYPALVMLPYGTGTPKDYYNQSGSFHKNYQARTTNCFFIVLPNVTANPEDYESSAKFCAAIARYENLVRNSLDNAIAKENIKIDQSQIALAGSSFGGDLSWALSLRNPNLFRGAVVINSISSYRGTCGNESRDFASLDSNLELLRENNARFSMLLSEDLDHYGKNESGKGGRRAMREAVQLLDDNRITHQFELIPGEELNPSSIRTEKMLESVDYVLFN
ncbi:hypothetical protein [Moorena sp. SIO3I6]|uniref:hypothetical protein n=1 Tax=Moorena sp. SIO3I6 TaxID=2607831 RepID=UPI0013FA84B2|nr:hypothetical protein [Moorena sp. SIO3I6]NEP21930.1 hypothetical protein [Moorena sp. SIO3I6]